MQTLVAYVENKPGVLNRVSSLARRLAINIDSLTVGPTENEEIARMTIVAHTDERGAHRLEASLEKLVDVLLAENISSRAVLERDLALIKVAADQQNRPHLMELIKVFRARVVDVAPESLIIEVSGTVDKIDGAHRPHCHDARRRSAPATFARRREFYVRTGRFEREVEGSRSHVPVPEIGRRSGVPKHPAQVQHTPGRTTANDQQNERTSWRISTTTTPRISR